MGISMPYSTYAPERHSNPDAYAAAVSPTAGLIIEDFRRFHRNTLRGFCRVVLPSGMVLSEVAVHVDGTRAWAMPASRPMLDRDSTVMRDEGGKIRYVPIVGFASKAHRDRFSDSVIGVLQRSHPEALS